MRLSYTPPPGWDFATVGDLAKPEKGSIRIGPFGSALKKHEYSENGIRVLGIEDVHPNQFLSDRCKYIPDAKFCELRQYEVSDGDVLVTNMGTVGRACAVPAGTQRSIISSHLIKVSLNRSRADPTYLCWMLNYSPLVVAQIRAKSHGAIMAGFNSSLLKSLRIPLPPLAEQKRIAVILDAADALRAKRRQALAQLDTLLQSTFLDMFGDPVTNPMGWKTPALSEVTDEIYRYPTYFGIVYENEGVPEIRGELIGKGGKLDTDPSKLRFIAQATSDKFPRTQLAAGDLVMSVRGTIGKIGIVPAELINANMTANLIRISSARSIIDPVFLLHLALGPYFLDQLSRASSSTTIKTIKSLDIKAIPIPLPPLDLQRRFSAIVESVECQKASQRAHLDELDTLFASLQSRAFRGDL